MPRANYARGKVRGARPRTPARGDTPLRPPGRFPFRSRFQNGPRRQGFATPRTKSRALDCSGPFRKPTEIRESGQMQRGRRSLPLVGPEQSQKGDISIEALRGTFLSRLDTPCRPVLTHRFPEC